LIAVTLQRDAMDIGGNPGILSIGELPASVHSSNLTMVPLRSYTPAEGGLPGPANSPLEVYPLPWEIMIDNIYFDGVQLPVSSLTPSAIGLSAAIDTGTSVLLGPQDTVSHIQQLLGANGVFNCAEPHNLSFEIGGKIFPVDPRDFATQAASSSAEFCASNLFITDSPVAGSTFLYSWVLGVPFLKGVISSFYFGNISYPSQDPPKIGLFSTVPSNASDIMKADASAAISAGTFPFTSQAASSNVAIPTATVTHTSTIGLNTDLQSGDRVSYTLYLSSTVYLFLLVTGLNIGLW